MFEKKILSLAEAECALWNTKGVFPSCLVLNMESPATGVHLWLLAGWLKEGISWVWLGGRCQCGLRGVALSGKETGIEC